MSKFTPDNELDLLFSADIIPSEVRAQLPPDLHIRPLASSDHARSHLETLSILTPAPALSPTTYKAHFDFLRSCPSTYFTIVIISKGQQPDGAHQGNDTTTSPSVKPAKSAAPVDHIVAVGTVFVERKFTRSMGKVGHIEDIAVSPSQQGRGLGLKIIKALMSISETEGCYKTILNCSEANVPFYEKCGFTRKETEMVKYNIVENIGQNSRMPTPAGSRVHSPKL